MSASPFTKRTDAEHLLHDIESTFQENITVSSSLVAFKYRYTVYREEFF